MNQHTPGPWDWRRGRLMHGDSVDDAGYPMPEIALESNYGTSEANARLIAAAPDLLAALEQIVAILSDDRCQVCKAWPGGDCAHDCEVGIARAAIAKARGE